MPLLKPAMNEQAFLKAGFLGFAGSGKTTTASLLASAIAKRVEGGKPVAFIDTETGSDFLIPKFQAEGVELLVVKTAAFRDLLEAGKEAESSCSVLIVDSITHIWNELNEAQLAAVNAGLKKRGKAPLKKLEFQHMAEVKRTWGQWTTFFLNSRLHIIVCGRAGFEWEWEVNEDTGKKELTKVGTKMKVESEFGFEPSLLVEMERVPKGADAGAGWLHRAHILKDRTDTINGKAFDFEKPGAKAKVGDSTAVYKAFEPVLKALNIGGAHVAMDTTRTNDGMFNDDGQSPATVRAQQVEIIVESVQNLMALIWPGQDAVAKQTRLMFCELLTDKPSWTAVTKMPLEKLQDAERLLKFVREQMQDRQPFDDASAAIEFVKLCREQMLAAVEATAL